jgi:SEC-C motif-containing protein
MGNDRVMDAETRCPCGTGHTYGECCQPFHLAKALAPTAERTMRARYSAFVVQNAAYLLASWHSSTRPNTMTFDPEVEWQRLEILGRTHGGMLDTEGTVEFRAYFRSNGVRAEQQENSAFVRVNKVWLYVDEVAP